MKVKDGPGEGVCLREMGYGGNRRRRRTLHGVRRTGTRTCCGGSGDKVDLSKRKPDDMLTRGTELEQPDKDLNLSER